MDPFISICIPAYKHVDFLKRLLDSIAAQTYRNFEVVITDDSGDATVEDLLQAYKDHFSLVYIRNPQALGSPENWNEGIRNARGSWIKMMHDDDWFADQHALGLFAEAAKEHSDASLIFSGYNEVDLSNGHHRSFVISRYWLRKLKRSPFYLLKRNFIGHPSTTLIRNNGHCFYDARLKWVVDIEFYMRYLDQYDSIFAIKKPLVNIGISKEQITKLAFRNPAIEIPEVLYLYYKLPEHSFHNIWAYDYFWRFLRNLSIRRRRDLEKYAAGLQIPAMLEDMIKWQRFWPLWLLRIGPFSKGMMLLSYLRHLISK
jgi:glycosyltransferase involved in cell wall biosynthesis